MSTKTLLAGTAALVLLGAGSAQAAAPTATAAKDTSPVAQTGQMMASTDQGGQTMNMRQQLHDQLTKDGYTGVTITPSSFFVRAKDKAGHPVAMVIGPDSFTAVTELAPQNTAANTAGADKPATTPDTTPAPAQK